MDSNAKTAGTANEPMRQNHLQIKAAHDLSNHQEHKTLNFPALWGLELYLARHIVLQVFFPELNVRTGPTDGGPARVARRGWAGGGRERGADRATRTRSAETGESASMIGPAGG
jgi:hypothetical protein